MVSFGERLRKERESRRLTQDALAERLGQSRKSQVRYESGERSPDAEYLAALARIGIDIHYLVTGERSRPDPLLLMICGAEVRQVYAALGRDLSPEDQFNQAVWVYDQLLAQVANLEDGDAIEAALPEIRERLRQRLTEATGPAGST